MLWIQADNHTNPNLEAQAERENKVQKNPESQLARQTFSKTQNPKATKRQKTRSYAYKHVKQWNGLVKK